ncbi:SH3 domain-containing protein [Leptospira sp. 'Mane']
MNIKKNTLITFSILIISFIQVILSETKDNRIELSETRIVDTENGNLRLRAKPLLESDVIDNIPSGTRIVFIKSEDDQKEINGKIGRWNLVNYNDKIGWVFDAFLIKVFKIANERSDSEYNCHVNDVLTEKFGKIGKRKNLKANQKDSETEKYEERYNQNIYSLTTIYYGGGYTKIKFPNKKIEDIYGFFSSCDKDLAEVKFEPKNEVFKVEFEAESGYLKSYYFEFKNNITSVIFGGQT